MKVSKVVRRAGVVAVVVGLNAWAWRAQEARVAALEGERIRAETLSDRGAALRELRRRAVRAEERAEALESRVGVLEAQVRAMASREVMVDADGAVPAREALLGVLESGDEEIDARLREVLRAQRKTMREEWRQRRRERWDSWASERLSELSREADLSVEQQEALAVQLKGERDEIVRIVRQSRRKLDFLGGFNKLMDLRRETDEVARAELDDDQAMAYATWRKKEVDQLMGLVKGVVGFAMRGGPPSQDAEPR